MLLLPGNLGANQWNTCRCMQVFFLCWVQIKGASASRQLARTGVGCQPLKYMQVHAIILLVLGANKRCLCFQPTWQGVATCLLLACISKVTREGSYSSCVECKQKAWTTPKQLESPFTRWEQLFILCMLCANKGYSLQQPPVFPSHASLPDACWSLHTCRHVAASQSFSRQD